MATGSVVLIPHGLTEWNVDKRLQGWSDSPLLPEGRSQIVRLVHLLCAHPLITNDVTVHVQSSDLGRAQESRDVLCNVFKQMGVRFVLHEPSDYLREVNFGKLNGVRRSELHQWGMDEGSFTLVDGYDFRMFGGESADDAVKRFHSGFKQSVTCPRSAEINVFLGHIRLFRTLMSRCDYPDPTQFKRGMFAVFSFENLLNVPLGFFKI